jgi:hypothetical protein
MEEEGDVDGVSGGVDRGVEISGDLKSFGIKNKTKTGMLLFIGLKLLTIVPNCNLIVTAANSFIGISNEAFLIGNYC